MTATLKPKPAIDLDQALGTLQHWRADATSLSAMYARAGGMPLVTAKLRVEGVSAHKLELSGTQTHFVFDLAGARFNWEAVPFFSAPFMSGAPSAEVTGLQVWLANGDYLFLAEQPMPAPVGRIN